MYDIITVNSLCINIIIIVTLDYISIDIAKHNFLV